jgi:hypothetical protein
MESNSDKQLRDKLQGFEVPFDPEAWAQMEEMLDKKKKRRGFFWWWFGGIAAGVLLVGVLGYRFGKQEMRNELAASSHAATTTSANNTNNEQGEELTEIAKGEIETNSTNATTTGTDRLTEKTSNETVSTTNKPTGSGNGLMAVNKAASTNGSKRSTNGRTKAGTGKNKADISKRDKQNAQRLAQNGEEGTEAQASSTVVTTEATGGVQPVATAAKQEQLNEVTALNLMWADKLKREEDKLSDEKKDVASLPKKKRIFRYSVGVMAGMYATTPGWKNYNNQDQGLTKAATIEKAAKPSFYSKPSWMVGLTHDFTFVDRFAFTNGLLYSQTTFKLYSPYAQAFSFAPDDYTSSISELAIPTGIKIYPVATKNFRLYVSAGFIHHIKVRENFTYTYTPPPLNSVTTGGITDTNYNFFPGATDFNGTGYEVVQADALGNPTTVKSNTTDFSINRAKRYYTSFYAGFGVEGIIKKHWILFAEPTYSMTMQRIGYQERRKYNFGGNAGFRYQF